MHTHRFHPDKADKLLSEKRKEQLPFVKIRQVMELDQHDVVADLGAGNGFFTIPIAKHTEGKVYAVDIEPKMLEILKERADKEQIENIDDVVSDLENIEIDDQSVDKVLISMVLHEVPNKEQALDEIKRILNPGGIAVFIEWEAIETEEGPPFHIRIPSGKLTEILQSHGFETTIFKLSSTYYAVKAKMV